MKEFKGTKGDWHIVGEPYINDGKYIGGFHVKSTEKRNGIYSKTITKVNAYEFYGQTFETAQANANLIAASKDLLEALHELIPLCEQTVKYRKKQGIHNLGGVFLDSAIDKSKAAINKALGQ